MPESLYFRPEACNFIKKETLTHMFSGEFCEIFKNTFFTEHLWKTASVYCDLHFELAQNSKLVKIFAIKKCVPSTWLCNNYLYITFWIIRNPDSRL